MEYPIKVEEKGLIECGEELAAACSAMDAFATKRYKLGKKFWDMAVKIYDLDITVVHKYDSEKLEIVRSCSE